MELENITVFRLGRALVLLPSLLGSSGCVDPSSEHPWDVEDSRALVTATHTETAVPYDPNAFQVVVPLGIDRAKIALSARYGLTIGHGATVSRTDDGHSLRQFGFVGAGGPITIESNAQVGSAYALGADATFRLGANATVHGYVKASGAVDLVDSGRVTVGILKGVPSMLESYSWKVSFPDVANENAVAQPSDATPRDLPPGPYAAVSIQSHGTARMHAGHYHIASLRIEPNGTLELDNSAGAVFIWVRDTLELSGPIAAHLLGPNILIGYAGTRVPTIGVALRATVVAPFAELHLPTTTQAHRGSFFAHSLVIEADARVEHEAFNPTVPPSYKPELVCSSCLRATKAAADDCCRQLRTTTIAVAAAQRTCQLQCSSADREPIEICLARCEGQENVAMSQARFELEQCMAIGPRSVYGQCQLHHSYRPGACESLGYLLTASSCNY